MADERAERHQHHEDQPGVGVAVGDREVVREHREHDRQGEVVVVDRPLFSTGVPGRVGLLAGLLGADELPVHRDDHEEDVRGHDRPEHRADLDVGRARGEELGRCPRSEDDERRHADSERKLVGVEQPAERVVDEPRQHKTADRDQDCLGGREVGDRPVDQERGGVRVVDDDQETEPGEPGRIRLPLEPVEGVGDRLGRNLELLHAVEAAAVDLPRLAADAPCGVVLVGGGCEVVVERDEVERRADPGDPGDHVQPADEQVAPAPPVVGGG